VNKKGHARVPFAIASWITEAFGAKFSGES
jgi:hypothetical protein